jgi:hypothetical protein
MPTCSTPHAVWAATSCSTPPPNGEDPDEAAGRHAAAQRLCTHCTCLDPCRELAATIPASTRAGVWAGQVHTPDRTISSTRPTAGRTR